MSASASAAAGKSKSLLARAQERAAQARRDDGARGQSGPRQRTWNEDEVDEADEKGGGRDRADRDPAIWQVPRSPSQGLSPGGGRRVVPLS